MDILHEGLEPEDWEAPDTVIKEADEKSGITDYVSKTAKIRGEENRKKKAEKESKAQVEKDMKSYEAMKIQKLEDVFTARTLFAKIRNGLNDITDEKFRKEYQERLFSKQKEFCSLRKNGKMRLMPILPRRKKNLECKNL